jgi:hypothetical protein
MTWTKTKLTVAVVLVALSLVAFIGWLNPWVSLY